MAGSGSHFSLLPLVVKALADRQFFPSGRYVVRLSADTLLAQGSAMIPLTGFVYHLQYRIILEVFW